MAWTQYIESSIDTLDLIDVPVTVNDSIYVIGHEKTKGELQVHIFHAETSTWDIVSFTEDTSVAIPKTKLGSITVAHNDSVLVYSGYSLFVLNTETLRWNRLLTNSYASVYWCGCCMLDGELYVFRMKTMCTYELCVLDLGIMRWKTESEVELDIHPFPLRILAYETRIYIYTYNCDIYTLQNIMYYDTEIKRWGCFNVPLSLDLSEIAWPCFFYSKHFYIFSGILGERILVSKYSLECNKWERITFEGVPPLGISVKWNVVVLNNKAFFFKLYPAAILVLDLEPSLKTRSLVAVARYGLDTSCLPASLQTELSKYRRPT